LNGSCEEGEWRLERGREAVGTRRGRGWGEEGKRLERGGKEVGARRGGGGKEVAGEAVISEEGGEKWWRTVRSGKDGLVSTFVGQYYTHDSL